MIRPKPRFSVRDVETAEVLAVYDESMQARAGAITSAVSGQAVQVVDDVRGTVHVTITNNGGSIVFFEGEPVKPLGFWEALAGHVTALNWHAVRLYWLSRWLWEHDNRALALLVSGFNRVLTGVEIPPSAEFGPGLIIMHGHGIVVHHAIRAGRDCTLYQGVTLGSTSVEGFPPVLGDGVTLFPGAKVLGPVALGDGCQVGANAVVLKSYPAGSILGGVPARLL